MVLYIWKLILDRISKRTTLHSREIKKSILLLNNVMSDWRRAKKFVFLPNFFLMTFKTFFFFGFLCVGLTDQEKQGVSLTCSVVHYVYDFFFYF